MDLDPLHQQVRELAGILGPGMSRFDPPVSRAAVDAFERANRVTLPDDYRWFVTHVASGGPGPACGLLGFPWAAVDERLARPWIDPLRWSDAEDEGADADEDDDDGGVDQGVLAVGDLGCGGLAVLVLVGPHRGELWYDLTAGSDGYRRVAGSFVEWYGGWVQAELARRREAADQAQGRLDAAFAAATGEPHTGEALRRALYALGPARDAARFRELFERAIALGVLGATSAPSIVDEALAMSLGEAALRLVDRHLGQPDAEGGADAMTFRCLRALVCAELGDHRAAVADWAAARARHDFDPPPRCAARIACALLAAGDVAGAVGVYVDAEGGVVGPARQVVDEALRRDQPELAVAWCEAFLERLEALAGDDEVTDLLADAHAAIAVPLLNTRRAAEADAHLAAADRLGGRIDWPRAALAACQARAFEASLRFLDRCSGRPWWIANLRGCCLEGLDRLDEALAAFDASLRSRHWLVPFENRAYALIRLGRLGEAARLLDEVEAFAPEFPWTHYHRAALLVRQGDTARAEAAMARALALGIDPAEILSLAELAELAGSSP